MTDTSTQAVEAIINACGKIRTRDDAIRVALAARRTALEDAAKVAKSLTVDTTGAVAEYMIGKAEGMRFAAKEIYTAICALIEEEQK